MNVAIRILVAVCLLIVGHSDGWCKGTMEPDTVAKAYRAPEFYRFRPNQLIVPGALLAMGVTGVCAFSGLKASVQHHFSGVSCGHSTNIDNYLQYAPAAAYVGLGFIPGVKRRGEFCDRLMAGVTAYVVMIAATNVLKISIDEPRPGAPHERNSFPSGHTATAFTGAELMRIEYGNWVGTAGYAVAVTVGALRIYNNRHWISDVLGGAAIGIISARIGYWLLPLERRIFGLDKRKTSAAISLMPMVGNTNGVAFAMTF